MGDAVNMSTVPGVSRKRIALAKTALQEYNVDAMIFFDRDEYGRKLADTGAFTALILYPDGDPTIIAHSIERDHAESESALEIVEIDDNAQIFETACDRS
jgi:precorrin-6B methylase 1